MNSPAQEQFDAHLADLFEQLRGISDGKFTGKVVINFVGGTAVDLEWPNKVKLLRANKV